MENRAGPQKGLHRPPHIKSSNLGWPRPFLILSLSAMSSFPQREETQTGRRPALLYTFISIIALGGLLAFYCTSFFDFGSFSQSFSPPVSEEPVIKPATTVISMHAGSAITVVPEEFSPHTTSSITVIVDHVPSQPTVSAILHPISTPSPAAADVLHASTTDIDFTDPFNVTRNVFYGIVAPPFH